MCKVGWEDKRVGVLCTGFPIVNGAGGKSVAGSFLERNGLGRYLCFGQWRGTNGYSK